MSLQVALEHRTTYGFAAPVRLGPHVVRLRPAPHARTPVIGYALTVSPGDHALHWHQDPFGNWQARVSFPEEVTSLELDVALRADLTPVNPLDFVVDPYAAAYPFTYDPQTWSDLGPYLRPVEGALTVDALRRSAGTTLGTGTGAGDVPIVTLLADLTSVVHRAVGYTVRMEAGFQDPDTTLARGVGSCRDSAWLLVALLRSHGLAARFVSGYLVQLAGGGPGAPAVDSLDLHAWAEAYLPGAGWVGMDPTSSLFTAEGHVPLSATPHPTSAAPVTGTTGPVEVSFSYDHTVTRIDPSRP